MTSNVAYQPDPHFRNGAAPAEADPELEPHGLRVASAPLLVCPPKLLQPLLAPCPRKFAHSLRFVLPRMSVPADRSLATKAAS